MKEGLFAPDALALLREKLTEPNLAATIDILHDDANWPEVTISFKAKGRKGSIGQQGMMANYRGHMADMMILLAKARK